jgi:hypothetical protein
LAGYGQWVKREAGKTSQVKSGAAPATVGELSQVSVPLRSGVGRRLGRDLPLTSPYTDLRRGGTCCGGQHRCEMTGSYSRNHFGTPLIPFTCLEVLVNARRVQVDL